MDKLKAELQALKEICDEAKKEGDKKMEIEAQLQINKVSAQIANLQ
ncbi:MAG: hypothetical protein LBG52_05760 [Candidatus Peribacteria bacterium]|nr:hypothetical protein [Candidatus Peribacteria bacterium]